MFLRILCFMLLVLPFSAHANNVPPTIEACFNRAVTELMLVNRTDRARVKQVFMKHTDLNRLGSRAFGGATWRNASPAWKDRALDMYFSLLYSKNDSLTAGMQNAVNTTINSRLADRPDIKPSQGYHVVASVTLDNGKSFAVAVLISPECKAYDFAQGSWASRWLSPEEVDASLKK